MTSKPPCCEKCQHRRKNWRVDGVGCSDASCPCHKEKKDDEDIIQEGLEKLYGPTTEPAAHCDKCAQYEIVEAVGCANLSCPCHTPTPIANDIEKSIKNYARILLPTPTTEPAADGEFESFDSFFAGLSAKDEVKAIHLYEKYIKSFISDLLRKEREEGAKAEAERRKHFWYYAGAWHVAECPFILHDEGVCNCKTGANGRIIQSPPTSQNEGV